MGATYLILLEGQGCSPTCYPPENESRLVTHRHEWVADNLVR
jgi:hypothetical protein